MRAIGPLMLVPMAVTESAVEPMVGTCFLCGSEVDGDLLEHFAQQHPRASDKTIAKIRSGMHRLDDIVKAIEEIREESDIAVQIQRLDAEVITELYLVRASLTQQKRRAAQLKEEGSHGSS